MISFFTTIGNYDYGFYWYLYLDGTIAAARSRRPASCSPRPTRATGTRTPREIAPGLGAPYHQHLFSRAAGHGRRRPSATPSTSRRRRACRWATDNPYGNAFTRRATRLTRESEARASPTRAVGRIWHVVNPESTNRLGQPGRRTRCTPRASRRCSPTSAPSIAGRAAFATKHLWVTAYDPASAIRPATSSTSTPAGRACRPYVADRPSTSTAQDVVLWHTFGLTHFPRPEDWPIMPVDYAGFRLKPVGFFDRNPTLDVPPSSNGHCHS